MAAFLAACGIPDVDVEGPATHLTAEAMADHPESLDGQRWVSSGQPDASVLDVLADRGFVAVVDLRGVDEDRGMDERKEVEARGMRYETLPVETAEDATYDRAATMSSLLHSIDGPVLVHCASGNRVGAMFSLAARAEGATEAEALAIGEQAGLTRAREVVEEKLEDPPR